MHHLEIGSAQGILAAAIAALAASGAAWAEEGDCDDPEHADVQMQAFDGGVSVGAGDFCDGDFVPDWSVRVFSATFFNNPALPDFFNGKAFNPGFNASAGAFEPFTSISFNVLGPLRIWSETDQDFDDIPAEVLTISTAAASVDTPAGDGEVQPGFFFAASDDAGSFHVHPTFTLGEPKGEGVYLLTLELTAPNAGLAPSEPIFIVLNQLKDEAVFDEAVAYAEDVLAAPPGPECPTDIDGSGVTNSADLNALLVDFGEAGAGLAADIDGDGDVDSADLNTLLAAFGQTCA